MPTSGTEQRSSVSSGVVDAARYALVQRLMDSLLHDVRNPLNALAINLDVLTEKLRGPERLVPAHQEKNLKAMREQVFRVDGILKAFAEVLAPRASGPSDPGTFTDRVVRALDILGHELRRNRIVLRQMLEPAVHARGSDNAALSFLPLQALVRAIARCPAGGEISITLTTDRGRCTLQVTDSGANDHEPFSDAAIALQLEAERQGGEARVSGRETLITLPLAQ